MQILAVSSAQLYRSFSVMSVLATVGLPDSIKSKQVAKGLTWICTPSKRRQCPETRLDAGYQDCRSELFQIPVPTQDTTSCRSHFVRAEPWILSDPACWHGISNAQVSTQESVCLSAVCERTHTHMLAHSDPSVSESRLSEMKVQSPGTKLLPSKNVPFFPD